MPYQPKIITGKVKDTGWPIDGHVLYFSQWDYDPEGWHLYGWDDEADEAVMLTVYEIETEDGICACTTLEAFTEMWKAKLWNPDGVFSFPLDKVDVLEVKQEEVKNEKRAELLARGFDLRPRKNTDKGGILCLPMEKNLNGDIKAKHPDWELLKCPNCGRGCWATPHHRKMEVTQGVQLLCTECALEAGLLTPYRADNSPKPGGNYKQRRKAKQAQKRRERHERKKRQ